MKPRLKLNQARRLCAALPAFYAALIFIVQANDAPRPANAAAPKSSAPIPWSQLGAKAGADYQGDGLAVIPTPAGARLRCVFQRLEGEATREGLWLSSTVTNAVNDRFRVAAAAVGRVTPCAPQLEATSSNGAHGVTRPTALLATTGSAEGADQPVRFLR